MLGVSFFFNLKKIFFRFLEGELTNPNLKEKFCILDSLFFGKLSEDENSTLDTPLKNYNCVKRVSFFLLKKTKFITLM